ncbi:PAS domain S-box protein [Niveibacterium terrae]|uniref:PAS domain-containing protein n=1 Tax=Niveibacterium terrae TaxID=3373598 RepID=UPI003A8EA2B8
MQPFNTLIIFISSCFGLAGAITEWFWRSNRCSHLLPAAATLHSREGNGHERASEKALPPPDAAQQSPGPEGERDHAATRLQDLLTAENLTDLANVFLDLLAQRIEFERAELCLNQSKVLAKDAHHFPGTATEAESSLAIRLADRPRESNAQGTESAKLFKHVLPVFFGRHRIATLRLDSFCVLESRAQWAIENTLPVLASCIELCKYRNAVSLLRISEQRKNQEIKTLSEQLRTEQQRTRNTESWYQGIVNFSPDGILIADENGTIIMANPATDELFAYPPGSLIGKPIELLVPTDYRERHQALRNEFIRARSPNRTERRIGEQRGQRSDGSEFPAEIGLATLPARGGRGACFYASIRDISLRKRVETELRQTNEEQIAILETATTGIAFVKDRKVIRCNRALERLFGCSRDELLGTPTRTSFPDEKLYTSVSESIDRKLAQGDSFSEEIQLLRKNGSLFWCKLNGSAVAPLDPQRGSVWLLDDITEHRKAEQAAADERMRLQRILDSSPTCIAFVVARKIRFCNPAFQETFGTKPGDDVQDLYVRKEARSEWLARLQREGMARNIELQLKDSHSRVRSMLGTFLHFNLDGSEGELGWLTDITDRKRAEDCLQDQIRELERFNLLSIDREERMIQLKEEINELLEQAGRKRKYRSTRIAHIEEGGAKNGAYLQPAYRRGLTQK